MGRPGHVSGAIRYSEANLTAVAASVIILGTSVRTRRYDRLRRHVTADKSEYHPLLMDHCVWDSA
jgi:ABC-type Zn2+ transport system substrate-binding protein/surface adhesin